MATYKLSFQSAPTWEQLRAAWTCVVTQLRGTTGPWQLGQRVEGSDQNFPPAAFEASWTCEGASLSESVVNGGGNPHDGYGYDIRSALVVDTDGGSVVVTLLCGGYDPLPQPSTLVVQGSAEQLDAVRAGLRAALGSENDRSSGPTVAVANVAEARQHDPAAALRWLREALELGRPAGAAWGWAELLKLAEELEAPDPGRLARRLVEAPHDVAAWQEAEQQPPPGWTVERITRILARLRPYDPGASRPPFGDRAAMDVAWRRLETGTGPTGTSDPLMWNLARALYPGLPDGERGLPDASRSGRRALSTVVRAVWIEPGDELPAVLVERRATAKGSQRARAWLFGPSSGDVVRFAMDWTRRGQRTLHLGVALATSGTPDFVGRVEEALKQVTPYALVPVSAQDPLPERSRRVLVGLSGVGSHIEQVTELLERAGVAEPELVEALRACRCEQPAVGYCEHARALLDSSRHHGQLANRSPDVKAGALARARQYALSAGLALLAPTPFSRVERDAISAAGYLAIAAAVR